MEKILYSCIFSIFFLGIVSSVAVQADGAKSQRWVCLEAVKCGPDKAVNCPNIPDSQVGHIAKLSVKTDPASKLLSNAPTYIIECLITAAEKKCTAGFSAIHDADIDRVVAVEQDLRSLNYEFEYLQNKDFTAMSPVLTEPNIKYTVKSDASGSFPNEPYYWKSKTVPAFDRKFFGLNFFVPTPTPVGGRGGQQQATFSFEDAAKNCAAIRWDPYGRVFDSVTLEPVANTQVTLLGLTGGAYERVSLFGLPNPATTDVGGAFSFVVPDGIYRLAVSVPEYTFPFTYSSTNPHPNYTLIYSDLYYVDPVPTGTTSVTGQNIIQQGTVQHRDIPLDPNPYSVSHALSIKAYSHDLLKATNETLLEITFSHPFAKMDVYGQIPLIDQTGKPVTDKSGAIMYSRGALIKTVHADKNGFVTTTIQNTTLLKNETCCEIVGTKVDLKTYRPSAQLNVIQKIISTIQKLTQNDVQAVETGKTLQMNLNPIFNNIEGYAYDLNGKVIPSAVVGIYILSAKAPYYETKADEKGYYKIGSENLPFMEYRIKYSLPSGQSIDIPTVQFLAQNTNVIAEKNINLNVYKNQKGEVMVVKPSLGAGGTGQPSDLTTSPVRNRNNQTTISNFASSNILLLGVVLLVFIGIVGAGLTIYMIKKKQPPPTPY